MAMNKKKWLGLGLIAVIITVPLVLRAKSSGDGKGVEIQTAALQEIRPTILASGTLSYRTEVKLTAEVLARVKEVLVKEGQQVEQGQLLLRLDPQTYHNAIEREQAGQRQNKIAIEQQQINLELRRSQYARTDKLFKAGMIDHSKFDEASNLLKLAEVELKSSQEALHRSNAILSEAREQLNKTEVRAPISGIIVDLPIKVGETAIPSTMALNGAQLMTLADTSAPRAELKVDEGDIAKINIGQNVDLFPATSPDKPIKGQVEKIALAPIVEAQARAYKVTVNFNSPQDGKLRSGMSCRAEIYLADGKKRLAVPVEAILSELGEDKKPKHFLMLARNSKAHKVEIELGQSDDKWQEVSKGLKVGEQFVGGPGKALNGLKEGEAITHQPVEKKSAKKDEDKDD